MLKGITSVKKRKLLIITLLLAASLMTGCSHRTTQPVQSEENSEPSEANNTQTMDYSSYNGTWTLNGSTHDEILANGGAELNANISEDGIFTGSMYTQQGSTERFAEINDITQKIENNSFTYDFLDDGWGGTGTLLITFLDDKIQVEVQNYKMDQSNTSGYGISGSYLLTREADAISQESSEESSFFADNELKDKELSEEELQEKVYDTYYKSWNEADMEEALISKAPYYQKSAYHDEVMNYWEKIRGVTDISNVIEPLYNTDLKYYSQDDFKSAPPTIIFLAKNEIYARHGYIFRDADLENYFMGCLWYEPTCDADEFTDEVFNKYERVNLELLADLDSH